MKEPLLIVLLSLLMAVAIGFCIMNDNVINRQRNLINRQFNLIEKQAEFIDELMIEAKNRNH